MQKIMNLARKTGKTSLTALDSSVSTLFNSYLDYKKLVEEEKTKREYIQASKEVYIAKVENTRKVIEKYLDLTFSERRENLDNFFKILEKGIEEKDTKAMEIALCGINTIVSTSALKDVKQLLQDARSEDQKEIEF